MIDVTSSLTLPDKRKFEFHHQSIKNYFNTHDISYFASYDSYVPLMNVINNGLNHSLKTRTKIYFDEMNQIVEQVSYELENSDWYLLNNAAYGQLETNVQLPSQNFMPLTISKIEVQSELVEELKPAEIIDIKVDTTGITRNKNFKVKAMMMIGNETKEFEDIFTLPKYSANVYGISINISATSKQNLDIKPTTMAEFLIKINGWNGRTILAIKVDFYPYSSSGVMFKM